LIARHCHKVQQLSFELPEGDEDISSTLTMARLQRAFTLRPTLRCFSRLSALTILGHDRDINIIESSALHYLIQRLKHNPIVTNLFHAHHHCAMRRAVNPTPNPAEYSTDTNVMLCCCAHEKRDSAELMASTISADRSWIRVELVCIHFL